MKIAHLGICQAIIGVTRVDTSFGLMEPLGLDSSIQEMEFDSKINCILLES